MKFRTEIEIPKSPWQITHGDRIVMLGSCFTDNIGERLEREGFQVTHNPMGPLYNPKSIENVIVRAKLHQTYETNDLIKDPAGIWHCLDFATRYSSADPDELLDNLNADIADLGEKLSQATVTIFTLGTAWYYSYRDGENSRVVGNCHKLPPSCFDRDCLTVSNASCALCNMALGTSENSRILFTVSPIRHVADGLHENQLSKATLLLAINQAVNDTILSNYVEEVNYFPAYEIMIDDLRDYRFYAADMKHPSDVAIDYIYEKFADTYFSAATKEEARKRLALWKRANHRQITNDK